MLKLVHQLTIAKKIQQPYQMWSCFCFFLLRFSCHMDMLRKEKPLSANILAERGFATLRAQTNRLVNPHHPNRLAGVRLVLNWLPGVSARSALLRDEVPIRITAVRLLGLNVFTTESSSMS